MNLSQVGGTSDMRREKAKGSNRAQNWLLRAVGSH